MPRETRRAAASLSIVALSLAAPLPAYAAATCTSEALTALKITNLTVASAADTAASGPFPAYCDVKGAVMTDGDGAGPNSAGVEIKLPQKWNGKLVFFGVGGLAGSLSPSANPHDFGSALGRGFATAITDTGHVGKNPFDADWILEAPDRKSVV